MNAEEQDGMTSLPDQQSTRSDLEHTRPSGDSLQQVGTTIDERYEILSLLGRGGMSVVYKAHHKLLDKTVAVKMLLKGTVASHESLQRFQHEAKAISHLEHPNIIKVHAFVASEAGVYLVMDYLEGISIADIIEDEAMMPAKRAMPIFRQVAWALEHAHSRGIIHRDLKPSNIMIVHDAESGRDDFVKLVDFGIAKLMPHEGEQVQQLTRAGAVFGTPAYMSPEQCTGKPLDARSDIYAFGCVMFEILTGNPPLEGESALSTMYLQLQEEAPLLSDAMRGKETSLELERIIEKCLKKDPEERFQSMTEVVSAIQEAEGHQTTVTRLPSAAPKKIRHSKTLFRRREIIAGVAILVLLVAAVVLGKDQLLTGYYLWKLRFQSDSTEELMDDRRSLGEISSSNGRFSDAFVHARERAELARTREANSKEEFDAWVEAAEMAQRANDKDGEVTSLVNALNVRLSQSEPLTDDVTFEIAKNLAAMAETPELFQLVFRVARTYQSQDLDSKADELLKTAKFEPQDPNELLAYLMMRGRIKAKLGQLEAAETAFNAAIDRSPRKQRANQIFLGGLNFQDANHFKSALKYYDQSAPLAVASNDGVLQILIERRRGECLAVLGKQEEAIPHFRKSIELWETGIFNLDTDYVKALHGLGLSYLATKRDNEALATFGRECYWLKFRLRDKIGLDQWVIALKGLADSLFNTGKYAEAAGVYGAITTQAKMNNSPDEEIYRRKAEESFQKANRQVVPLAVVESRYCK